MGDWDTGGLKTSVSELLPDVERSLAFKENGKQRGGNHDFSWLYLFCLGSKSTQIFKGLQFLSQIFNEKSLFFRKKGLRFPQKELIL